MVTEVPKSKPGLSAEVYLSRRTFGSGSLGWPQSPAGDAKGKWGIGKGPSGAGTGSGWHQGGSSRKAWDGLLQQWKDTQASLRADLTVLGRCGCELWL